MKSFITMLLLPVLSYAYMGMGVEMEVYITGCQTHPLASAHIAILGEQVALETDKDGFYEFEFSVEPGEHTIYAYTEFSEFYRDDFTVVEGMAGIDWHIMLCTCVENWLTYLTGVVMDSEGSPVAGATVSVDDLFISTESSKSGYYTLAVPPGEWEVIARETNYGNSSKAFKFAGADDPSLESETVKHNFKLSK